ncbi:ATP-binding protein [uncultured Sphaerochaeta sp.]|uniref:ATP-binding protein n=1 Tax=uncultured Sphaerochaeta sp. TaxID=886478 RepID=UPI002A0A4493|nr:ATP-binding protein [uncultured Sphaerochaeta sp.]
MPVETTIKKETKGRFLLMVLALTIVVAVILLMTSIFQQYSTIVIETSKTKQMTIVKNIAEALKTEINQTKQGLFFFVDSGDFKDALSSLTDDHIEWPLNRLALSYSVYNSQIIENMIIYTDSVDNPLWRLKQKNYSYLSTVSNDEFSKIDLWLGGADNHDCFLSITVRNSQGITVRAMLDLQMIYERHVAQVKLGEKGYALVKNSDGVVIMYHLREQIGINAVTERQSLYPDVKLEMDSLKKMIEHQKEGKEGVDIYQSYWWDSKALKKVTKMAAYCPVIIDNGFLIVSAVTDYQEITNQATGGMIKVVLLTLLICLLLFGVVVALLMMFRERTEMEQRNDYLNQLNKTLLTLHENEQMIFHQQRLQSIGTMTSGIAHEFNNLLTPIMGYSTLMTEQMDESNPFYDDAKEILLASEKAKDIIQQILFLGSRNTETVYTYTNAFALLKKTESMLRGVLAPNVTLQMQLEDHESGFFCNTTQIYQVLMNLVLNAEAALGGKDGIITLGYSVVKKDDIDSKVSKKTWEEFDSQITRYGQITISDNGCGMEAENLDKIFDPFFTTKSSTGGTGLGLSIVQNIITSHKGSISVVSELGKGSCFTIFLPLAEAFSSETVDEEIANSALIPKHGKVRILLVDDNTSVLKVLQRSLSKEHVEVYATADPLDAFSILKKEKFNILVTDDYMSGMNGLNLAMKAKLMRPDMPIIILTGLLRKEIVEAQQSKIIHSYLIKPVSFDELMRCILRAIEPSLNKD